MTSSDSTGAITSRINKGYPSFPNMIKFQLGKRKKELFAREGDECIVSNANEAKTGGNGTPTRKTKLHKMNPASLQPNTGVQFYNTNTRIFGIKDGIHLKRSDADYGTENCMSKEKVHGGRSLDMLIDAIQLIEGQKLQRIVDQLAQRKDLISVLPENIIQDINNVGRPSLENQQLRANGCPEDSEKVVLDRQPLDAGYNCKDISEVVDIDSRAMLHTRSKGGWLPTLPSKYSDSVLQPWKKVTRKYPNIRR